MVDNDEVCYIYIYIYIYMCVCWLNILTLNHDHKIKDRVFFQTGLDELSSIQSIKITFVCFFNNM
jgi:hypothetical protein